MIWPGVSSRPPPLSALLLNHWYGRTKCNSQVFMFPQTQCSYNKTKNNYVKRKNTPLYWSTGMLTASTEKRGFHNNKKQKQSKEMWSRSALHSAHTVKWTPEKGHSYMEITSACWSPDSAQADQMHPCLGCLWMTDVSASLVLWVSQTYYQNQNNQFHIIHKNYSMKSVSGK